MQTLVTKWQINRQGGSDFALSYLALGMEASRCRGCATVLTRCLYGTSCSFDQLPKCPENTSTTTVVSPLKSRKGKISWPRSQNLTDYMPGVVPGTTEVGTGRFVSCKCFMNFLKLIGGFLSGSCLPVLVLPTSSACTDYYQVTAQSLVASVFLLSSYVPH